MATRPIWRGNLRLGLVSCPVALYSVVRRSNEVHFHFINPKTGHRVRMVTLDAGTDEELSRQELVRGYEFDKDRYVLLDEADFESARIESSSTMAVDKFVARASIPPLYFDASYYLVPDDEAGQEVFVVLREAIARSGQAALSRVVIARRERAVAILPIDDGLVCHTLHEPRDLYDSGPLFEPTAKLTPDREMVALAQRLIERQQGRFKPADSEDRYETRLRAVIAAKLKGEGISPGPSETPRRDNVVDLMAALKASLAGGDRAGASLQGRKTARGKSAAKRRAPAQRRTRA